MIENNNNEPDNENIFLNLGLRPRPKNPIQLIKNYDLPEISQSLGRILILFILFMLIFLVAIPWQQTSNGTGRVMAYLPQDRVQNIHATIQGRIKQWFVKEGTYVEKGEPILEMIDIDAKYLERINLEIKALNSQLEAAKIVKSTAEIDFKRQTNLFHKGISSRKDMEQAKISFKNAESAEAQAFSNLTQAESKLSRQESQIIKAPSDGTIVRLLIGTTSSVIDQGQVVAVFVPKSDNLSAELFINGNDLPLIHEGRKVRLQFEGWPAIQLSGWPSVAVGTFAGEVVVVDQTSTTEGLFRIIVVPLKGSKWPESRFIRQGTRVNGWVLLNRVSLGYEIWRQFNGFPPSMQTAPEELATSEITPIPD